MGFLSLLWWLLVLHALTDYALQPPMIARYKSPLYWDEESSKVGPWWWHMGAHSLINGGGVAWVTGFWWLGVAEMVVHFATDTSKCYGKIGTWTDQGIHLGSKGLWALIATGEYTT